MTTKEELIRMATQGGGKWPHNDLTYLAILEVLIDIRDAIKGPCITIENKHRFDNLYGGDREL